MPDTQTPKPNRIVLVSAYFPPAVGGTGNVMTVYSALSGTAGDAGIDTFSSNNMATALRTGMQAFIVEGDYNAFPDVNTGNSC